MTESIERRFSALFHASPVAIGISSLADGCFHDVNAAFAGLFGYERDELLGASSLVLGLWANPDDRRELFGRLAQGEATVHGEVGIVTRQGEIRRVLASAQILEFGGRPSLLTHLVDVTERHAQERALAEREAQLRAVFDAAAEGILVHDADGIVTLANASATRILHASTDELTRASAAGTAWEAMHLDGTPFPDGERPAMVALRTGEGQSDVVMGLRRDGGETTWISVNARPVLPAGAERPSAVVASFADVTQRLADEQTLRASEARFRALTDSAPIGVYETDPEGRCRFVNARWQAIAGLSLEESLGHGWARAIHPDDREAVWEAWQRAVADGDEIAREYRFRRPDGGVRWVSNRARQMRDADGTLLGYVGTVEDITDRRANEEALRLSEERIGRAFDFAMSGMALNDLDGRYVRVNAALCAMTGYAEHELLGMTIAQITHPDDRAEADPLLADLIAGRVQSYRREKRYVHRDGHAVWVEVCAALVRDGAGRPAQLVAQIQDISARRAAEKSLRDSEARFRALLEHAGDAVLLVDERGIVRWASPAVARVLGREPGQLVGRDNAWMIHPDDQRRLRRAFVQVLRAGGDPRRATLRVRHRDGRWRWLEAVGSNRLADPAVRGVVINARDVTDRIELEERLRREALHDALTGLANRALFHDRLTQALAGVRRTGTALALLFVDLDGFKGVNDRLGHAAGDQVLITVGQRLVANVRETDTVARIGGDEFAVILPEVAGDDEAELIRARLVQACALPVPVAGELLTVGASIGLALSRDGFGTPADLLATADRRMYQAKQRRAAPPTQDPVLVPVGERG